MRQGGLTNPGASAMRHSQVYMQALTRPRFVVQNSTTPAPQWLGALAHKRVVHESALRV
jgi:hypothetical protein